MDFNLVFYIEIYISLYGLKIKKPRVVRLLYYYNTKYFQINEIITYQLTDVKRNYHGCITLVNLYKTLS